ncbi:hypothetical protein [Nocardioides sp. B-3]|uniref:hypothetical protein n=1 Tax=Nocardioides sp. B-3 TaxID=2895565 RepID=UPI002152BB0C|nr:hypothetical protein [Nocardioides sp. B-3]UUZ59093.1 hypothetical protein LP418_24585 [Nocardioides sp. B-3]
MSDSRIGTTVTHRRYVPYSHAHYAGNLVDGAYSLGLFGDVATELCIQLDGDEGLFASYSDVQFKAPVRAGDVLEITATPGPGRHPEPGHGLRRQRGRARRSDARGARRGQHAVASRGGHDGHRDRGRPADAIERVDLAACHAPTRRFSDVFPRNLRRAGAALTCEDALSQVRGPLTGGLLGVSVPWSARADHGWRTDVRVAGSGGVVPASSAVLVHGGRSRTMRVDTGGALAP